MKKILALILVIATITPLVSGRGQGKWDYSHSMDVYIEQCSDLPIVRPLNGGMVFHIEYVGKDWTNERKGAFEHACKIWEENIPHCPPLRIKAEFAEIKTAVYPAPLSKVMMRKIANFGGDPEDYVVAQSHMKAIVFREYEKGFHKRFVDSIKSRMDLDNPAVPDIHIVFNKKRIDEFSFSIDPTPSDRYDFITLTLREIARGLGFNSSIRNNPVKPKEFIVDIDSLTNYEMQIWPRILVDGNVEQTYLNATCGGIDMKFCNMISHTSRLFAPSEWENSYSLNYFIPDSVYKITQLLTYQFGRGTVIRDISDTKYPEMFRGLFRWFPDFPTGLDALGEGVTVAGSTGNVIPYDMGFGLEDLGISPSAIKSEIKSNNTYYNDGRYRYIPGDNAIVDSCFRIYHSAYRVSDDYFTCNNAVDVSILKKDGSWDYIGGTNAGALLHGIKLKISDMEFHYPDSAYATTADGHLRARITFGQMRQGSGLGWKSYYYAISYHPQSIEARYDKILRKGADMGLDANLREIKISIKNLEGVDRILVEQMEEGHRVPSRFEVDDFKKGFFKAVVNKDINTSFTVISYNKHGSTRGKTISVKPIEALIVRPDPLPGIVVDNSTVSLVDTTGETIITNGIAEYSVSSLNSLTGESRISGIIENKKAIINISTIPQGIYLLHYFDDNINSCYKFQKK